jgi:hypothetical protein
MQPPASIPCILSGVNLHQVWLASERSITCYAAANAPGAPPAQLYTLTQVEGYLRGLVPWSWGAWLLSSSGLTAVAARTSWEERQQQVRQKPVHTQTRRRSAGGREYLDSHRSISWLAGRGFLQVTTISRDPSMVAPRILFACQPLLPHMHCGFVLA